MVQNKSLIFKKIPEAWPVPGEHLTVEDRPFDLDQAPPPGGITTRNHYASFDPYMRGRMRDAARKSYAPPFPVGEPILSRSIVRVLKSDNPKFKPGDVVITLSTSPVEEYSALDKTTTDKSIALKNDLGLDVRHFLGALGMPGLTAYSSFYEIGQPKKGETIFVSAASGAVGQLVGQLAKHEGLRVVGSVGSDDKLKFILEDMGFDAGFNYKAEKPGDALARLAPDGIDIYYENVGGEQLEAALSSMRDFGRIVACGMISQYNLPPTETYGIRNLGVVVAKRLTMRGFIVGDANMGPRYAEEHQRRVQAWLADGSFKAAFSSTVGMDAAADGLVGMLRGRNFGKAVLEICALEGVDGKS